MLRLLIPIPLPSRWPQKTTYPTIRHSLLTTQTIQVSKYILGDTALRGQGTYTAANFASFCPQLPAKPFHSVNVLICVILCYILHIWNKTLNDGPCMTHGMSPSQPWAGVTPFLSATFSNRDPLTFPWSFIKILLLASWPVSRNLLSSSLLLPDTPIVNAQKSI